MANSSPTEATHPIRAVQFVNTLAISDGGPARNSFEVNLALNALPDVTVQMFWLSGERAGSVLAGDPRPAPFVSSFRRNLRKAASMFAASDVVIIHGFYLPWVPLVTAACRLRGIPFVIMPHGVFTDFQRGQSASRKRAFDVVVGRRIRKHAAAFLVATDGERDELTRFAPEATVSVCGVGTAAAVRAAAGDAHTPLRLISMSRVAPKKRIDVAIKTVAALEARGVEATLDIAGTGDPVLMDSLRTTAEEAAVAHRIRFRGEVAGARKTELLADADVFLAPSEDENFGIAVAEALAHGLPVIATRRVNAASIAEGIAGAMIDEPSDEAAADRIVDMLARDDFAEMRTRAVGLAAEHYGWAAVAERWRRELRRAASSRGR